MKAFRFTNANGKRCYIRYQILPLAAEHALNEEESAKATPDYLMQELPTHLAKGPVKYRLLAQIANEGDAVDDGTVVWPPQTACRRG